MTVFQPSIMLVAACALVLGASPVRPSHAATTQEQTSTKTATKTATSTVSSPAKTELETAIEKIKTDFDAIKSAIAPQDYQSILKDAQALQKKIDEAKPVAKCIIDVAVANARVVKTYDELKGKTALPGFGEVEKKKFDELRKADAETWKKATSDKSITLDECNKTLKALLAEEEILTVASKPAVTVLSSDQNVRRCQISVIQDLGANNPNVAKDAQQKGKVRFDYAKLRYKSVLSAKDVADLDTQVEKLKTTWEATQKSDMTLEACKKFSDAYNLIVADVATKAKVSGPDLVKCESETQTILQSVTKMASEFTSNMMESAFAVTKSQSGGGNVKYAGWTNALCNTAIGSGVKPVTNVENEVGAISTSISTKFGAGTWNLVACQAEKKTAEALETRAKAGCDTFKYVTK